MYYCAKDTLETEFGEVFKKFCERDYFYSIKLMDILEKKISQNLKSEFEDVVDAFYTYYSLRFEHFEKYFFTALSNTFAPNIFTKK